MFKMLFFILVYTNLICSSSKILSADVKKCKNWCVYSDYYVDLFNQVIFINLIYEINLTIGDILD